MQTVCSLSRRSLNRCAGFAIARLSLMLAFCLMPAFGLADEPQGPEGDSSRSTRNAATSAIPFQKLPGRTQQTLDDVVRNPSFFRRMPTQQIACDPQMLQFLVRRPEVLVNIWELMGITNVSAQRRSPTTFLADDGVGTKCVCDLVYSDDRVHVYYGSGDYDGSMTPRKVKGRCVCVLHTKSYHQRDGSQVVAGTMDVFIKLDNFGADLLTRTLGPFVGKTADYNFVETAKFVAQISQLCMRSPAAAQGLAMRLESIEPSVRSEFAGLAARIAANAMPAQQQVESPLVQPQSSQLQPGQLRGSAQRPGEVSQREAMQLGYRGYSDSREAAGTFSDRPAGGRVSNTSPEADLPTKRAPLFTADVPSDSRNTLAPPATNLRLTDGNGDTPSDRLIGSPDVPTATVGSAPPLAIRPFKPHAVMRR
jgi:hypothetical protein